MAVPRNAILAAFAALALAGCQAETAPLEKASRPVRVESVVYADDAVTRDFVGVVAPRTETDLAFRVGGKVVARPVGVGDRVKAGDVIARLDAADLTLALESAEAEFAAATSSLAGGFGPRALRCPQGARPCHDGGIRPEVARP